MEPIPFTRTSHQPRLGFPPELAAIQAQVQRRARAYGLDVFEIIFEMVDFDEMNEVAAFGGFPTRYPYWRFGMLYDRLRKGYAYGLQKIYELVVNNDPCYAYLLKSNNLVDQKLVIAHVYGHCDFFKNNYWFGPTNRKMMDAMANHGNRVRGLMDRWGRETVEEFIDRALSLENLIDIHAPYIVRHRTRPPELADDAPPPVVRKMRSKAYMDAYVNPPEFLAEQKRQLEAELERRRNFPEEPERDVLLFLIEHAPIDRWQRDCLTIIRDEAYYFAPQGMTKIMNEGWASYWHSHLMTHDLLDGSEVIDYADHHAGTMGTRPGVINPYKLGLELLRDIEDRWDKGRFGPEYERCQDLDRRRRWDLGLKQGREKIFQVRRIFNDITFIDEFLTPEFCEAQQLFTYKYEKGKERYVIESRDFHEVKERLLATLANNGQPVILVENGNFRNRGELLLVHRHDGVDLRRDWAQAALQALQAIWGRPVHIRTLIGGKERLLGYDGRKKTDEAFS